jgi:hypothetical protein
MAIEFNDREERAGSREERLSQDWIFDESWWGDGELTDGISAEAAGISAEALRAVNHDELRQKLKAFDDKIPAEEKLPAAPSSLPQPHRSLRVYLGASTYLLVPVEYSASTDASGSSTGVPELLHEALVVTRNPPHTIEPASIERVKFLRAHARDSVSAEALLGVVQFEWEAFLVLLTNSQVH